jgi:Fe-S-cluster containining protein
MARQRRGAGAAARGGRRVNGHALRARPAPGGADRDSFEPLDVPLLVEKAPDHPCHQCAKCCTYVAIQIDRPRSNVEYDYIVWYLLHAGVSVFVDWEGDWYVKFETRCRQLTDGGLCGIYERRPAICRDFDWRECEQTVKDEPPDQFLFETAEQFTDWLRARRPRSWRRFQEFQRARRRGKGDRELRRLRPRAAREEGPGAEDAPQGEGAGVAGGLAPSFSTSRSSSLRC